MDTLSTASNDYEQPTAKPNFRPSIADKFSNPNTKRVQQILLAGLGAIALDLPTPAKAYGAETALPATHKCTPEPGEKVVYFDREGKCLKPDEVDEMSRDNGYLPHNISYEIVDFPEPRHDYLLSPERVQAFWKCYVPSEHLLDTTLIDFEALDKAVKANGGEMTYELIRESMNPGLPQANEIKDPSGCTS